MKIWVLFILALVLFFFTFREGFNVQTTRPDESDPTIMNAIKAYTGLTDNDYDKIQKYLTQIQLYYDSNFLPNKQASDQDITLFVGGISDAEIDKGKLTQLIMYIFEVVPQTAVYGRQDGTTSNDTTQQLIISDDSGTTSTATGATGATGAASSSGSASPEYMSAEGNKLWGPAFVGFGEPRNGGANGSGSTRVYPTLLGGGIEGGARAEGEAGTGRGFGGGIGGFGISAGSLGINANSGFFPSSRVPGDQDLIPDPYRLRSQFTTSSYSSKTDPVPFLTDFSAFFK